VQAWNVKELLREALAVFGGRRLTPSIRVRLEDAVDYAVRGGQLKDGGGLLTSTARD
jgi:hypothetical protein